jgi:glycerophosphoryl diester phosphodiesterase
VGNLKALNDSIMPVASIDLPLVQLFGSSGRPYDFVVSGDNRTYTDLSTPTGLAEIATYAAGIGPNKQRIVPLQTVDNNNDGNPDDLNGDGQISDGDRLTGNPTTLIADAHAAGLLVHLYTLRNESFFLPASYGGDPINEYKQLIELGVDGFFTDFPGTGFTARSTFIQEPAVANLGGSKGFEGQAINPDKTKIYTLLEGPVAGDPTNALRLDEFDLATQTYAGIKGFYRLENPAYAIGDMAVINENEYLVIERDGGQGSAAQFKKIYKIDLCQTDANGFFVKEEVADLLNIADPNDLNGDGLNTYRMPFVTIEDVVVIDANTILVANDNNYPFSVGRPPAIDNNEMVVLQLETPLNLDPRVGVPGLNLPRTIRGTEVDDFLDAPDGRTDSTTVLGLGGHDTLIGGDGDDQLDGGNGDDVLIDLVGDNRLLGGSGDDFLIAGAGNDLLDGGSGFNDLFGGGSRDIFILNSNPGQTSQSRIFDFQDGVDLLGLAGSLSFRQLRIESNPYLGLPNGTSISLAATGEILGVVGIAASLLNASDFILA